ncbi:hypothetical protein GOACH_07_01850 [Gordonia aichiensis NBRC 108223]|uniref:Uncharacterized protein n=1 Tax=Gordonia aichiensis NBRC 108223 TaxID=1220583 RepID=L7KJW9_9ACTN|nr:hypothetical protein GOACH_07_01850 [Gordonia aichiensis NBRC 108223]
MPRESLSARLRQVRQATRAQRMGSEGSARELILVAFGVPVVTLMVLVVCVLAVLLMSGGDVSGIASVISACWLAIHQVPLTMNGVTLGVLPMLPTLLVAAGTAGFASSASRVGRSPSEVAAIAAAAVGGPLVITAMALAVLMDGSADMPVTAPNALLAFGCTIALHGLATAAGVAWRRRRDLAAQTSVTAADRRGFRFGLLAAVALLAAGSLLVLVRLLLSFSEVGHLIAGGYRFDGYLGLTVLSILYLPNAIVGATAVLVGADVHIGAMSVDLLSVRTGPMPPVPLLAALPDADHGMLGIVGFAVPVAVAGYVGWRCRSLDPIAHVRAVGVAGAVAASIVVLLAWPAGGRLGEIGETGVNAAAAGVFTLGWIVVVGLIVALIYGCLPSTRRARLEAAPHLDENDDLDTWFDDSGFDDDYVVDSWYEDVDETDPDGIRSDADTDEIDVDGIGFNAVTDETDVDGAEFDADGDETDSDSAGFDAGTDETDVDGIGFDADGTAETAPRPRGAKSDPLGSQM